MTIKPSDDEQAQMQALFNLSADLAEELEKYEHTNDFMNALAGSAGFDPSALAKFVAQHSKEQEEFDPTVHFASYAMGLFVGAVIGAKFAKEVASQAAEG